MVESREWMAVDFRKDIRMARIPDFGPNRFEYQIWILGDKGVSCAKPLTFEKTEEGAMMPEPTFKIGGDEVQWLMDEMWRSGIRPTEVGTAGQVDSIKYHLEDMRKLVFEKKE